MAREDIHLFKNDNSLQALYVSDNTIYVMWMNYCNISFTYKRFKQ